MALRLRYRRPSQLVVGDWVDVELVFHYPHLLVIFMRSIRRGISGVQIDEVDDGRR